MSKPIDILPTKSSSSSSDAINNNVESRHREKRRRKKSVHRNFDDANWIKSLTNSSKKSNSSIDPVLKQLFVLYRRSEAAIPPAEVPKRNFRSLLMKHQYRPLPPFHFRWEIPWEHQHHPTNHSEAKRALLVFILPANKSSSSEINTIQFQKISLLMKNMKIG